MTVDYSNQLTTVRAGATAHGAAPMVAATDVFPRREQLIFTNMYPETEEFSSPQERLHKIQPVHRLEVILGATTQPSCAAQVAQLSRLG